MKRIRVIHFTDSLRAGGKERQIDELLKGLSTYKEIVCELAIMSKDIHYDAVNNLDIKIHYLIRKSKKDPRILVKLYKICKVFKPDIIHTWDSMTSVYAVPIAKLLDVKLVNGMIRNAPEILKFFSKNYVRSKLTFPFSDVIVSNSYAGLRAYNVILREAVCIHNGFDHSRIENVRDKKSIKAIFMINTDKVVGMVASFSSTKDYETHISAAQMVLHKRNDVTFLAVGDGPNLERCKKLVNPQFKNKIKFIGKQQNVESIINVFDIGVLSTHGEGISNSIMEYMALGKPVVATYGGGTCELVLDGETGFLVPPCNSKMLAERIRQLLDDKKLSDKMGMAGKQRIKTGFSLEKMSNSFYDLYQGLIG